MTDDIKAIRDALQAVNFYKKGGFSYNAHEFHIAANPLRIARLLDAHDRLQAACSAAHAMLLRGEDDREILAVLEVWKGNA